VYKRQLQNGAPLFKRLILIEESTSGIEVQSAFTTVD